MVCGEHQIWILFVKTLIKVVNTIMKALGLLTSKE